MTNRCENCGCILNNGICSNCQEELYIYENQYEFLPNDISKDFLEKVKEQKEEAKEQREKMNITKNQINKNMEEDNDK